MVMLHSKGIKVTHRILTQDILHQWIKTLNTDQNHQITNFWQFIGW